MINIVVAYDDNDTDLGDYFHESYTNLLQCLQGVNVVPVAVLRGLDCNEDNINSAVTPLNGNRFLFVGLSHGDETGTYLLTENDNYVSPVNCINFCNSFFYTTGCNVGLNLRERLLHHGCHVFIGYSIESRAAYTDKFNSIFIDCELHALKNFLTSNRTISELFSEMLDYTQTQVDLLSDAGEIIDAMHLLENKDGFVIHGNGSLTNPHFQLN